MMWLGVDVPEKSPAIWAARMIAPDDLLYDRQSAQGPDVDILLGYLNKGTSHPSGVLSEVKELLRQAHQCGWMVPYEAENVVLWQDEAMCVVANTNGSYGYVYVAAFLWPKEA